MTNKNTNFISFDEMESSKHTEKQGLISKLLERVKNTIIFDNPEPKDNKNYNPITTTPEVNLNVEPKRPNSRASNHSSSEAIRNLRKTVEESNTRLPENKFDLANVIPKFIYSSDNNSETSRSLDTQTDMGSKGYNEWEGRKRKDSFTTNTSSPNIDFEISKNSLQSNMETNKNNFYKNGEGNNSSSSLFNTRPTEAVTNILKRLQGQGGGINKAYWMKDEHCHECYNCSKPFSQLFRRKHHCRICGQIFCGDCASNMISGESMGHNGLIRVCDYCFTLRNSVNNQDSNQRNYDSDSCTYVINQFPNKTNHTLNNCLSKEHINEEFNNLRNINSNQLDQNIKPEGLKSLLTAGTRVANNLEFKMDNNLILPTEIINNKKVTQIDDSIDNNNGNNNSNNNKLDDKLRKENINEEIMDEKEVKYQRLNKMINKKDNYSMITGFKDSISYNKKSGIFNEEGKFKSHSFPRKSLMNSNLTSPNARKLMRKLTISLLDNNLPSSTIKTKSLFDNHINAASLSHLKKLFNELLAEAHISQEEGWEDIIIPLVLQASFKMNLNVKGGDSMDILRYVKIKKIPGGLPINSEYIDGVVCSKNLTHKMMSRKLIRPRILIITFPFEYQRVDYQFMSIEPVIAQESEHLKNMVARVLALRPTLVIAERTISRIALDFLYKANLCVAMNVKRSVIRAIARCTQAEIISSLEQLWLEPRLGDCEIFEVQTFMHEMIPTFKKSYLYFKGCKEDLGCTIILRGGTIDKLNKIKNIVRLLVNAAYSLKLETVLLRDELAKIPSPEVNNDTLIELEDVNNINEKIYISSDLNPLSLDTDKLIQPFNIKILSSSPFIKFPVPYLLLKMKEEVNKIQELNEKYKCNISKEDNNSNNYILKNESKQNEPKYYSEFMPDKGANALIEEHIQTFKSYHAFLNNFRPSLSPASHQSITILYCNVSLFQTIICQPPQSYTIEYYKSSDLTLGQFLELSCFDLKVLCGTCDQSVIKHSKSYVHGNARITVTVEELPSPIAGMESTILMWSYCKLCEKVLPVVPMAEETWKLSLGKYLELSFYQTNLNVRAGLCPHDIHRDHVRYFGYNDLAAKFEFELIDLMEVNVPPTKLYFNHQISIDLKLKDFNNFKIKINKYWDSVSEKVKSLLMYSISAAKSETCRQDLMEMSRRVAAERSYTLQILQQTYLNSHPTDTLALNLVLRILQEKITEWDNEFTNVIQKYLQNEKDLRRLTTNQLRRLFPEREIENDNLIEREKLLKELTELENSKNIIKLKEEKEEENNLNTYFPLLGTSPKDNDILCYMANTLNDMPMELIYKPIMNPISYRRNSLKLMLEERQLKEERQLSPVPTQNPITPLPKAEKQIEDYLNLGFKKLQPKIIPMDDLGLETLSRRLIEDNNNNNNNNNNILSHKPNKVSLGGTISKNNNKQFLLNNKYSTGTLSRNVLTPKLNIPSLNNSARNSPKPPIKIMTQMNNNNNNNNNNKQLQQNIIKNLKKADDSIKNKYNLKSVERRNLDKKKLNEPLEFQYKVLSNRIKRANTTATSRPSRHGKAAIEIYLNTTEAVQDESDSEEENNLNEMKKPILSTLNNFDDLLSPNMETRELNLLRENQLNNNLMDNLLDFNLKPTLDLLPQNGSPNNSPPTSPKNDINNQQTNLFKDENNKTIIGLNNNNNQNNDRSSIIQTLSTFLGGVSAIGQIPLEYPIQVTEHIFPDSPIVLREDEPSSIIAFTLSTKEYFEQISLIRKSIYQNNNKGKLTQLHELTGNNNNNNNGIEDKIPMDIEKELKSQVGHHMRYQLNEGAVKLTCKIFYALQFEALRKYCDQEDLFIESLARCVKWNNSGGKSSAIFLKTRDNRLVMKEVSKAELDAFLKFAPLYFNHIGEALFEGLPVLLAKIFGIFRINIKNIHTGRSLKIDVLIMENLFYERKISRIFDLKGSFRNRHVQSTGKENEVLLDENFMEIICKSPIFIRSHSKQQLHMAIFNDTKFLSSLKVMDYSLLVGIDEENHQLIIGIVDFIRTFTWDKKLESWVKESGILGGGGELPTIVSPSNYKHRFRFNIDRYFLHVPDKFFNKKNALWIKNNRLHLP